MVVILWWRCDTLCASGFVDGIIFARNRTSEGDANKTVLKMTHQGKHGFYTAGSKPGILDYAHRLLSLQLFVSLGWTRVHNLVSPFDFTLASNTACCTTAHTRAFVS